MVYVFQYLCYYRRDEVFDLAIVHRKRGIWTIKSVSWIVPRKMVETSEDPGDQEWYGQCERMDESRGAAVEVLNQQEYNALVKGSI